MTVLQNSEFAALPDKDTLKLFLRPHYHLEGRTVPLLLVSKLPLIKKAEQ